MSRPVVVSVVESMLFPDFEALYCQQGLEEYRVNSIRKAINLAKKYQPAFIVVEFFYAYSTNYSGIYKSNIEVLLVSLIKHSPKTKVIVLANKKKSNMWAYWMRWIIHCTVYCSCLSLLHK